MFISPQISKYNNKLRASKILTPIAFSGDAFALVPYTRIGLTNRTLGDEFTLKRTDINEDIIFQSLTDPKNTKHVLITGKSACGKSVIAQHIADKLKKEGYPVFCFDNYRPDDGCSKDSKSYMFHNKGSYFSSETLEELTKSISNLPTNKRIFIFLDEPYLIAEKECFIPDNNPKQSVIKKLFQFLKENKNVKLVSIMPDTGISYINEYLNLDNNDGYLNSEITDELFSEKFVIPSIKENNTVIDMANKVLNSVGFKNMPEDIALQIRNISVNINPRLLIWAIFMELYDLPDRNDNIKVMEEIKGYVWKHVMQRLKENLNIQ